MDISTSWFRQSTSSSEAWPIDRVLAAKRASGLTVTVVIPARNEAATVGQVVGRILGELVEGAGLVDEVVVMDSDSDDDTARTAAAAGATVHRTVDVVPEAGSFPGKGEALWKSLFVTSGDLLVFLDADLTVWSPQFVVGLLGPLLSQPDTLLVKGHYHRLSPPGSADDEDGGRVTELVARPLLNLLWPGLAGVVQPLAGEWGVRRSLLETLPVPVGYGVELATLIDTFERHGLDALAQVDLGRRGHRNQPVRDLGVMAAELLGVVHRRGALIPGGALSPSLRQYDPVTGWTVRPVPTAERPPAVSEPSYAGRRLEATR
ncbi:glucosyl-3-phosphoglycerate synthase [Spirillospora sp. CA-142024]|uniref:glucosyl-3-phosphoglycerate synthase n=1 Tax=Spirillospora sp. CA-142024 TaxID=3240036 RepID=UPI003D8A6F54